MKIRQKITERYTWRVWFLPWYIVVVAVASVTTFSGFFLNGVVYHLLAGFCAGAALGLTQLTKLLNETPNGWVPAVAADKKRVDALRPTIEQVARARGKEIVLVQFTTRIDHETIR